MPDRLGGPRAPAAVHFAGGLQGPAFQDFWRIAGRFLRSVPLGAGDCPQPGGGSRQCAAPHAAPAYRQRDGGADHAGRTGGLCAGAGAHGSYGGGIGQSRGVGVIVGPNPAAMRSQESDVRSSKRRLLATIGCYEKSVGLEMASGCCGSSGLGTALTASERLAKMLAGRRSRVRVEARGRIEVGALVSYRMLVRKRGSSELDLGGSKPLDHKHGSTAPGAGPESRSANRARTWRIDEVRFLHGVQ